MFAFPIVWLKRERSLEQQELVIDTKTRIRLLEEEEECKLQTNAIMEGYAAPAFHPLYRDCIETCAKNVVEAQQNVYPVICALRLLKPQFIGINSVLFGEQDRRQLYPLTSLMEVSVSRIRVEERGVIFKLRKSEVEDFLKLCTNIRKKTEDKKLYLALGRFNMTYTQKWFDTRLLDYVIALESLYLPGDSEKQFRLCCYLVCALSSMSNDSDGQLWDYVEAAYLSRSKIIHGNGSLGTMVPIGRGQHKAEVPTGKFLDKIEEYTRQSLKRFVQTEETVEDFQLALKANIIGKIGAKPSEPQPVTHL